MSRLEYACFDRLVIHLVRRVCCDLTVAWTGGATDNSVTSSALDRILQRVFGPPCPAEFNNGKHQHEKNRRRYGKFHRRRSGIAAAEASDLTKRTRHFVNYSKRSCTGGAKLVIVQVQ